MTPTQTRHTYCILIRWVGASILVACLYDPNGVDAAVRVTVNCKNAPSCGQGATLVEVAKAYHAIHEDRSMCYWAKDVHARGDAQTHSEREGHTASCSKYGEVALTELVTSYGGWGYTYFWAPAENFPDSQIALEELTQRARNYGFRPIDTDTPEYSFFKDVGYVVVETEETTDEERHLALCLATQIEPQVGVPYRCETIAIITPTQTWFRGRFYDNRIPFAQLNVSFAVSGAIDIIFNLRNSTDLTRLSESLLTILQREAHFSVAKSIDKDDDGKIVRINFRSVTGLRDSNILPEGWRETVDFSLGLTSHGRDIHIWGIAFAMVSRQAAGSLDQYRGLTDAQRQTYGAALESYILMGLRDACANFRRIDAEQLSCQ